MTRAHRYLFLQGNASPFFDRLGMPIGLVLLFLYFLLGFFLYAAVFAMVVLGMGCGSATAPQSCETADGDNGGKRILFIGNSFTYGSGSAVRFYRSGTVADLNDEGIGGG